MSLVKKTIRTLIISIFTLFVLYGGYTIFAADEYSFESPNMGFYPVKAEYHSTMNDYFNYKIELFLDTELDSPNQIPPTDKACYDENISTYCVAMGAVDIFAAYMKTLDQVSAPILSLNKDAASQQPALLPIVGNPFAAVRSIFGAAADIDSAVDLERVEAEKVLDMSVAAYNEFRLAYPMHKKYEKIISDLYKYRDMIADITTKTMDFPGEFIDATSKSCQ
jgi:hypothetical protein